MRKPRIIAMKSIAWTDEAILHQVRGVALVKCIVELDGTMSDCRIQHGLPYMNEAVLEAARSIRYDGPILFCGRPQRVEMIVPLRLPPPPPPRARVRARPASTP
jgi:protein TonB